MKRQHLGAQFGNHLAVDAYHACCNEVVSLAAAAYACIGKEAVEADGGIGVDVCFLVLNLLLEGVLCVGVIVCRALAFGLGFALHGLARCHALLAAVLKNL